jgi:Flp pilus assembly pilin Flp
VRCGSQKAWTPNLIFKTKLLEAFYKEQTDMKTIKNFLTDESGMETLEYAVIAGLIAAVAVLVYASGWGTTLKTRLTAATTTG